MLCPTRGCVKQTGHPQCCSLRASRGRSQLAGSSTNALLSSLSPSRGGEEMFLVVSDTLQGYVGAEEHGLTLERTVLGLHHYCFVGLGRRNHTIRAARIMVRQRIWPMER